MTKVLQIKSRDTAEGASSANSVKENQERPSREYNRTPWKGSLDESELARPGGLLLAALIRCANERRQQLNDMSRELGVTYGYINQLRNGIRQVNQVSDDFALSCALYLGVPRMTVLMMAGRVTPKDVFEHSEMMASEINRAMAFICEDPYWGPLVTPEMRNLDVDSHFLIVRLYEKATNKKLMDNQLTLENLSQEIQKLQAIQEERIRSLKNYSTRKQ